MLINLKDWGMGVKCKRKLIPQMVVISLKFVIEEQATVMVKIRKVNKKKRSYIMTLAEDGQCCKSDHQWNKSGTDSARPVSGLETDGSVQE